MKNDVKRHYRGMFSRRPYQVVAVSAALVVTSGAGLMITRAFGDPAAPEPASTPSVAAAELNRGPGDHTSRSSRSEPTSAPSPSTSPTATKAPPATAAPAATATATASVRPTRSKPPSSKLLDIDYQAQINGWYCGPAATRIALTARGVDVSQDELASALNTTMNGTDSAQDVTRALNSLVKGDPYRTRWIPGGAATDAEIDRLQADVVKSISRGYAMVANIVGSAVDTAGGWHSFPGGHYVAVVGYQDNGRTVRISDPADASMPGYWLRTTDLANWMATRGYSA